MSTFLWFLCGLALGVACGYAIAVIQQQWASDAQATRRADRRRLLGLEDRPAARPDAIGHARIKTGDYRREVRGL